MATDMQQCETCPTSLPIEEMQAHGEVYLCPRCSADAVEAFHACTHNWEPGFDHMGDPGKQCHKCGGFVADEAA